MSNPLVEKYGKDSRWVNYKILTREGKPTKIPFSVSGKMASSTDPKTWGIYEEVKAKNNNVGIIFTPEKKLLGIDIDHCLNNGKIEHEEKEKIADLILEAETYTEISVSKTGLHLYLEVEEALTLKSNRKGSFEAYTESRYFVFTGESYGEEKQVRKVTKEEAEKLLAIIGYPWGKEETKNTKTMATETLPDDILLKKIFSAKNGDKIETLYNGDISAYKGDDSSADLGLCSHLAFWTGRNAEQMERIWIKSPLGQREKTQERKDYRDRTIKTAISNCTEIYETKEQKIKRENPTIDFLFTYNKQKDVVYTQNTENMCRILRKHRDFQGRFHFDTFRNKLEIFVDNKWRVFEDNDAVNIQTAISILFPFFGKVGKDMIYDAMIKVAKENKINSAVDYLRSLVWDKIPRLDTWLCQTYGVEDNKYHRAVGSNWIKGLVKRIVFPGCKFDYVLVLEGEQGSKKSMSLYVLGGNEIGENSWHVETTMSTDSKDFFMQFAGKAIIEFSEGETLSRTEVKKMKAIITMQSDKYRPPYERTSQDFPRQCVFAMTTNQEEYLKDETGNRRWLPVKVLLTEANVEWLQINRDQIFAEAFHRVVVLKEHIHEFPKEETLEEQSKRQIHDENDEIIQDWYFNKLTMIDRENGITCNQVFRDCICGGFTGGKNYDRWQEMKIANVLKNDLKLERKRKSIKGLQSQRWFQKEIVLGGEAEVITPEQKIRNEVINF